MTAEELRQKKNKETRERARSEKGKANYRERWQRNRIKVLTHYSGGTPRCACCGEYRLPFLSIDHIKGDGAEHRRNGGGNIVRWLLARGLPEGFQILCHNCNFAKDQNSVCPHKLPRSGPSLFRLFMTNQSPELFPKNISQWNYSDPMNNQLSEIF